jgi:hypothetical protein
MDRSAARRCCAGCPAPTMRDAHIAAVISSPNFGVVAVAAAGPGLRRGQVIYSGVFAVAGVPGAGIRWLCPSWRPEGADRNAVVYGSDGHVIAQEVLGDGIAEVLADRAGYVWVGYTEEGIYGNYGWGRPGSPKPVGASGLVRWSPDLRPAWRYPDLASPFGPIDDCYALNIDGTTAWMCHDGDFPILRTLPGDRLRVPGTRAVDGPVELEPVQGTRRPDHGCMADRYSSAPRHAVVGHRFGARWVVVTSGKRPDASTARTLSTTCCGVA